MSVMMKYTLESFFEDDDEWCDRTEVLLDDYLPPHREAYYSRYRADVERPDLIEASYDDKLGQEGYFKDFYGVRWSWSPHETMEDAFAKSWEKNIEGKLMSSKSQAWKIIIDNCFQGTGTASAGYPPDRLSYQ